MSKHKAGSVHRVPEVEQMLSSLDVGVPLYMMWYEEFDCGMERSYMSSVGYSNTGRRYTLIVFGCEDRYEYKHISDMCMRSI